MASKRLVEDDGEQCKISRKCSKSAGHKGRCNTEKSVNPFWATSASYKLNERKRKLLVEQHGFEQKVKAKESQLVERENLILHCQEQTQYDLREKGKITD
jgi:hypothetical protein